MTGRAGPPESSRQPDPEVVALSTETVYRGRIFDVRRERLRLPSGREQSVEIVAHAGAVAIAARLPSGELVLVRQYRRAAGEVLAEVPAGRIEPDEAPLDAARRELEEETGYEARHWRRLAEFFPAPGFCTERMHLFLAEGLRQVAGDRRPPDPDEELEVVLRTPEAVLASGCQDAKTLVAALLCRSGAPEAPGDDGRPRRS